MMFSSKPPYNDDPLPWSVGDPRDGRALRAQREVLVPVEWCEYDPRPEFARPQHNPTSNILAEFRTTLRYYDNKRLCLTHYIDYVTYGNVYGWTGDELSHAKKVLTRLANLAG